MAWCPKCKTEYREGIKLCADCKCELVDSIDDIKDYSVLASIEEEELAGKLVDYLKYSNFEAVCEFDEEQERYLVSVESKVIKEAKVAFRAFYAVESQKDMQRQLENAMREAEGGEGNEDAEGFYDAEAYEDADGAFAEDGSEEISEEEASARDKVLREKALENIVYKSDKVYVKKSDESKEMLSTAVTFIVFGVILLAFMILNALKVITLFSNIPSLIILAALSIGCLIVGLNAIGRAKRAGAQSVEEDKLTSLIDEWMNETITLEFIEAADDPDLNDELNYLRRVEAIKKALVAKFGDLDDSYCDTVIEEFYNTRFDTLE